MAGREDTALKMVLVGKTGSGKSATANTILGREEFASKIAGYAVTKSCQRASRERKGRDLLVVDTPGLFDTKEKLVTTCEQISRCVIYSRPCPHAIIQVLQLGRFTEEEQKTVALIKHLFGETAMNMIVLFTRKEELETSLDDFIAESSMNLQNLISECGNRYLAFSNRADRAEKEDQVQELVALIETMVQDNGGTYFSEAIYKKVEERLNRCMRELEQTYLKQMNDKIQGIEKEHADKSAQERREMRLRVERDYEEKRRNIRPQAEGNIFTWLSQFIYKILLKIRTCWRS